MSGVSAPVYCFTCHCATATTLHITYLTCSDSQNEHFRVHLQVSFSLQEEKDTFLGRFDAAQKPFVSDLQYLDHDTQIELF